jgi:hypothetical protein
VYFTIQATNLSNGYAIAFSPARLNPITDAFKGEPEHIEANRDISY